MDGESRVEEGQACICQGTPMEAVQVKGKITMEPSSRGLTNLMGWEKQTK